VISSRGGINAKGKGAGEGGIRGGEKVRLNRTNIGKLASNGRKIVDDAAILENRPIKSKGKVGGGKKVNKVCR